MARSVLGGFFMGLANLVPGISGGTMILALGLYDRFIGAVADVTRLRFTRASILFLALLAAGLGVALTTFSGIAVRLVAEHRWAMYALFIGMTLGGAPELVRAARPFRAATLFALLAGLALMAAFAWFMHGTQLPDSLPVLFGVGMIAAMGMILPGISGSYILLILGLYDTVIGSLSSSALRESFAGSVRIIAPVGIGAVLGIALLSNVLKALLARYSAASHAALLGLLVGSVFGLWPFQEAVHPELAHKPTRKAIEAVVIDGAALDDARGAQGLAPEVDLASFEQKWRGSSKGDLKSASLELRRFKPDAQRVGAVLGLLALGFGLTRLLSRREAGHG
ncbi:MAG: DUF368 domain-containing protein [Planctomycetota bacterium]